MTHKASYISLLESGELEKRMAFAMNGLAECRLCPHECKVNRVEGEKGFCKIAKKAMVSSYGAHFGEEPVISGNKGSGTVFFTGCNMRCIYCQNFDVSQALKGYEVTGELLAFFFLSLQEQGCHNINLVTPSHVIPQILEGLFLAAKEGLKIPIVYNSSGYDKVSTLQILDGIVDIYMPDIKYSDSETGLKLSKVKGYWPVAKKAIKEMFRQVGNLETDENGVAYKGILIRHLVLPGDLSGTKKVCEFIAEEISSEAVVNIMDQYHPCAKAFDYPPLDRPLFPEEFHQALEWAKEAGLKRVMKFWDKTA